MKLTDTTMCSVVYKTADVAPSGFLVEFKGATVMTRMWPIMPTVLWQLSAGSSIRALSGPTPVMTTSGQHVSHKTPFIQRRR